MDLSHLRQEYADRPLDVAHVDPSPFRQFERWYQEATDAELLEPNAMTLATVDAHGQPSQRTVLLKYFDAQGFVFFTNLGSRKATQIGVNPQVSALFPWIPLQRQVEISGSATPVSTAETAMGSDSSSVVRIREPATPAASAGTSTATATRITGPMRPPSATATTAVTVASVALVSGLRR